MGNVGYKGGDASAFQLKKYEQIKGTFRKRITRGRK